MTPEPDRVELLIDKLSAERTPNEPLYVTATRILYDGIDDLDDIDMEALETTGFEAVKHEGEPTEIRVPSVVRMIDAGQPYDHVWIDPEDRPKIMLLGFLALAAERLRSRREDFES